jgi:hypothetical protein
MQPKMHICKTLPWQLENIRGSVRDIVFDMWSRATTHYYKEHVHKQFYEIAGAAAVVSGVIMEPYKCDHFYRRKLYHSASKNLHTLNDATHHPSAIRQHCKYF